MQYFSKIILKFESIVTHLLMLPGDVGVEAGPHAGLVRAADGDGLHQARGELPHLARHGVGEPQRGRGQRL